MYTAALIWSHVTQLQLTQSWAFSKKELVVCFNWQWDGIVGGKITNEAINLIAVLSYMLFSRFQSCFTTQWMGNMEPYLREWNNVTAELDIVMLQQLDTNVTAELDTVMLQQSQI